MTPQLWVLVGAALAAPYLWVALRPRLRKRLVASGLVIAALIYVGFAAVGGAPVSWLAIELLGVGAYGLLAWLGWRVAPVWLAIGWGAHVFWDVAIHSHGTGASFTPHWYPPVCLGFDVAMAATLLVALRLRQPDGLSA